MEKQNSLSYLTFAKIGWFTEYKRDKFQQKLNNWVNFWFSVVKELWDLAQENLVDIQGTYGILDQYLWISDTIKTQLENDSYR